MDILSTVILSNFQTAKFSVDSIDIDKNTHHVTPLRNTDGTFDVLFYVNFDSKEFKYRDDSFNITKADVDIMFDIRKVSHNETTRKWHWKEENVSMDNIVIDAGELSPNILTYFGEEILNDCDTVKPFNGGLTEEEDIQLSKNLLKKILSNSKEEEIIELTKTLLSTINFPVEHAH